MDASLASGPSARRKGTHTVKDIEDMNGVMGACVGVVDAISAGQDPEVKGKVRKRTVREVASFVRLFKKAGILVAFLDGRRKESEYDPMGQKVAAVMLRPTTRRCDQLVALSKRVDVAITATGD